MRVGIHGAFDPSFSYFPFYSDNYCLWLDLCVRSVRSLYIPASVPSIPPIPSRYAILNHSTAFAGLVGSKAGNIF